MQNTLRCLLFLSLILLLSACVRNAPYRVALEKEHCFEPQADCSQSYIEKQLIYDLAYLEFTERGNLYSRERSREVMDFIDAQANTDDGAAVFVFVHGWKHNASERDSNVTQFKDFLSRAAENEIVGRRKVIGVFVGWRGKSSDLPIAKETTFWARKAVAQEIGSGGVTEILAELHQILVRQFAEQDGASKSHRNTYVIIGHSFGGAIVLSAMHDVLLYNIIAATNGKRSDSALACTKINRFADGLILLNPAIEANKVILLKEAAARCQFGAEQPILMHVLSSDADTATGVFFPIGRYFDVTRTLGPKKLQRRVNGEDITLNEGTLNAVTIGNLEQLRTAYLSFDSEQQQWRFDLCRDDLKKCGIHHADKQQNHFPNTVNDPLQFIKTDANFIKGHNDVFGCYVQSFITATIFETQSIDGGFLRNSNKKQDVEAGCNHQNFNFKQCFNNQLDAYDCEPPRG